MADGGPTAAWGAVTPSVSPRDESADEKVPADNSVRAFLYLTLEEPSSSTIAQVIASFILFCIVISIAALILESDPTIRQPYGDELSRVEIVTTVIFTVEYIVRLLVCGVGGLTIRKFVLAPANIIDLCAIVPFYVERIFQGGDVKFLKVLRAIRLVRLFRIFKVGRFAAGVRVMAEAILNSWHALNTLCFFVAVAMILFSSAVYYSEKLMCPNFDASEASQLRFMRYEEECRLGIPSSYLCCDYACNPGNPGVVKLPTTLDSWQAFGDRSDFSGNFSSLVKNFPNSLCIYNLTAEEWTEARRERIGVAQGEASQRGETLFANPGDEERWMRDFERSFVVTVVSSNTYKSIPHSFWWSIVSMTTTGFGDEVPETVAGKCFAIIAMCFGILLIALPVAIVGSKFQEAFAKMEAEQAKQREKNLDKLRRSLKKASTDAKSAFEEPEPRVEVPEPQSINVDELASSFFPQLAHLVQEVPVDHPAHASVTRVAQSYDELATIQAEIFAAQTISVQNQQALGVDMGIVFSNVDANFMAQNMPPRKMVNTKPNLP